MEQDEVKRLQREVNAAMATIKKLLKDISHLQQKNKQLEEMLSQHLKHSND